MPSADACYCWRGKARWPLRPEDRYCGLCGRRLRGVLPRAPLLEAGPPPVLAVYLRAEGAALAGALAFQLRGLWERPARLSWTGGEGLGIEATVSSLAADGTLTLHFHGRHRGLSLPCLAARGRLVLEWPGERFDYEAHLFASKGAHVRAWPCRAPGDPFQGTELVVFRQDTQARSYLHFELEEGLPLHLESLRCDHPAAQLEMLHPELAGPGADVAIDWDLSRLQPECAGVEAVFQARFRGLCEYSFRQRLWWRLRRPLLCQPLGLSLPSLAEDEPQTHEVRLTNLDRQPLVIDATLPEVSWVRAPEWPAGKRLELPPGGNASLRLELRPEALRGAAPYLGRVHFSLERHGRQHFQVHVGALRRRRRLTTPLLIDPGPPRVVLACAGRPGERPTYLSCSGDRGLDPVRLGLTTQEYVQPISTGKNVEPLVDRLVRAALDLARSHDHLEVEQVVVCRHPWLQELPGSARIRTANPTHVLLAMQGAIPPAIVLLDAWGSHALQQADWRPLAAAAVGEPLGVALMAWLGNRLLQMGRRGLRAWLQGNGKSTPGRHVALTAPWLHLACDALLADYRWGADFAWRRLFRTCWEQAPHSRRATLTIAEADDFLRRCLAHSVRQLCRGLGLDAAAPGCLILCPVVADGGMANEVRAAASREGVQARCLAPSWIDWLGSPAPDWPAAGPAASSPRGILSCVPG